MVTAASEATLAPAEVEQRASRLKLLLTDCDGVLTDNGVYYSARGEEMKRFSFRDGMGVERLRNAGVTTAILTREDSEIVVRRGAKLKIEVHRGVRDKADRLAQILAECGLSMEELGFIGDDVNDIGVMDLVRDRGLVGAPGDAMPEASERAHYVTKATGGYGAFREFAEWILSARTRVA